MVLKFRIVWLTLVLSLSQVLSQGQSFATKTAELRQYINDEMKRWQVPGLAVALVKDGQVLMHEGFGVKNIRVGTPVDDQTIFANCSTTKAMTAVAMAILVDEGKVGWTDRVQEHLPEFQLSDPYISRDMRVQDLFTHNLGLGNADFLWADSDLSPADILYRMRFAPIAYNLRGGYTYQNIMYLAAGEIVARKSGHSWAEFIQQRIFKPLGMYNTYPTLQSSQVQNNRSTPHHRVNTTIVPIKDSSADLIGAAGSVWSSAADMTIWIRALLDSTKHQGGRLISATSYAKLFEPLAIIPQPQFYPTANLTKPHWTTYGLGWFQHDYEGKMVQFHTGSLAGTVAILGLLPEDKLGIYVFGNLDHAEIRHGIMYKAFDIFANTGVKRNWSAEFYDMYQVLETKTKTQQQNKVLARRTGTQPSLKWDDYTGIYKHKFYGPVTIKKDQDRLVAHFSSMLMMPLEHWQYDQFRGQFSSYPWEPAEILTFVISEVGEVKQLLYQGIVFEK